MSEKYRGVSFHIEFPANSKTSQKNPEKAGRKFLQLFDTHLGLFWNQIAVYYVFPGPINLEFVGSYEL